jgi:hypothetical protein
MFSSRVVMPADAPSGRGIFAQAVLVMMLSPMSPFNGLVASKL